MRLQSRTIPDHAFKIVIPNMKSRKEAGTYTLREQNNLWRKMSLLLGLKNSVRVPIYYPHKENLRDPMR